MSLNAIKWIDVKERVPEAEDVIGFFLVWIAPKGEIEYGFCSIAQWHNGQWCDTHFIGMDDVSHWCYSPPGPHKQIALDMVLEEC